MIKSFDYVKTLAPIEKEILDAIKTSLYSGRLVLGPETKAFEKEFAEFIGVKYCIAVNSGTTALHLALMGLGIGPEDEVITVSNTCYPTVAAIELCGAKPVFVDVKKEDMMIDEAMIERCIGKRTTCILPVHLWGQSADMEKIKNIAQSKKLFLVEDCAQAHGTLFRNQHVGTFGNAGCFSFYPTKNLGAYGDAGAVVTNNTKFASRLCRLRNYGYNSTKRVEERGMNARISEIQAAILRVKLRYISHWMKRRQKIAKIYDDNLRHTNIITPYRHPDRAHSFHQYVIRCRQRELIIRKFKSKSIGFGIHYPIPVHLMPLYKNSKSNQKTLPVTELACNEILSLPIHDSLPDEEARKVASVIKKCLCLAQKE